MRTPCATKMKIAPDGAGRQQKHFCCSRLSRISQCFANEGVTTKTSKASQQTHVSWKLEANGGVVAMESHYINIYK